MNHDRIFQGFVLIGVAQVIASVNYAAYAAMPFSNITGAVIDIIGIYFVFVGVLDWRGKR